MEHIGKILPVHGYRVSLTSSLPVDYIQSLIHLYQPLIGIEAVSLYLTLLQDKKIQTEDDVFTHHLLMNQLGVSLPSIYKARTKLEAIGLMKTFKKDTEQTVVFNYILQPPFRPKYFFQDVMLSELLYREIGRTRFNVLHKNYTKEVDAFDGEEISARFNDVFQTVSSADTNITPIRNPIDNASEVPIHTIDFTPIVQSLEKNMIDSKKVLTTTNKRIIAQLMTLYDLASYEMEKALQWALTDENTIDEEQLKQACHDLFQQKHFTAYPKITPKMPEKVDIADEKSQTNMTKEELLIQTLETISPNQLLQDLSSGNEASADDIAMIRDVMTSQGLPAPVMNVIIHYVMLQTNMQLSKPYVSKIASHWSRVGLKTAREAMDFARGEIKKRTEKKEQATTTRKYNQSRKKEVIPDWFKEKQQAEQSKQVNTDSKEDEKEKEAMLALLHQHANK